MTSNLLRLDVTNIISRSLSESASQLHVVDPTPSTLNALIDVATNETGELPALRVLATNSVCKETFETFLVASRAADLIDGGTLSLRTLETTPTNSLLLTDESVIAVVAVGDQIAGLTTTDEAFVAHSTETYRDHWNNATPYTLLTPPLSAVRRTLTDEIGKQTRTDFDAVLNAVETTRDTSDGLDEVTISLLVAARNGVLLYDISKWGEDVGIASKATFSRSKTALEERGLIATEKVPIDVGRPRLRLKLGDETLANDRTEEFAAAVTDLLG